MKKIKFYAENILGGLILATPLAVIKYPHETLEGIVYLAKSVLQIFN